jgi:membrane protease YdiL (CAAX protease family)
MMSLNKPFLKLIIPAVTIALVTLVVHWRSLSWTEDLGLILPSLPSAAFWIIGWIAWVALVEVTSSKIGLPPPRKWTHLDAGRLAVLFIGIVLLAPVAEELFFRGLLYWRLEQTQAGVPGAILAAALVFTAMHVQYGWRELVLVFADGVLLGLARWQSDSLLLALCLHAIGNSFAYYQRLPSNSSFRLP